MSDLNISKVKRKINNHFKNNSKQQIIENLINSGYYHYSNLRNISYYTKEINMRNVEIYNKIIKVIESCVHPVHLEVADNMINQFDKLVYQENKNLINMLRIQLQKKADIIYD